MTLSASRTLTGASLIVILAALSACTTARTPPNQGLPTAPPPVPQTIAPVQTGEVNSSELPPIGGTTTGLPMPGSQFPPSPNATSPGFGVDDTAGLPSSGGRNLSGPLSMDMLLGGWTAMAGGVECRLNLTYTARGATGRYRASAPGCGNAALASTASWQLLGTQIQLYDANDQLIGTMAQSGNRFIGTLSGGTSITLAG